jgi:hypothetical protein
MRSPHDAASLTAGRGGQGTCYTEVSDFDCPVFGKQDVLGFDVPVYNAVLVGVGQPPADLNSDLDGALIREGLPVPNMFIQRVRDVLHEDVRRVSLYLEVMDTRDVGVIEAGGESGFSLEGLQVLRVVSDGLIDDLDGDDTVQHGVPSPVHSPLAAGGYPLKDFVSADSLEHGWWGL